MQQSTSQLPGANSLTTRRCAAPAGRRGFTLVELLVVIVIIGILASLITVAGYNALIAAKQAAIKVEINNINDAFANYKSKYGSYPPNVVYGYADGDPLTAAAQASIVAAVKQHFRKIYPRHREDAFINALVTANPPPTPAELLWLYLRGYSPDDEHPLTGGGVRQSRLQFDDTRLRPTGRSIGGIPMMAYYPKDSTQPFLYFNTSRNIPSAVPIYTDGTVTVAPYVQQDPQAALGTFRMVNPQSFQILSAGLDDDYGPLVFSINPTPLFPTGPFTGAHADNLVNFSTMNMGDSEP